MRRMAVRCAADWLPVLWSRQVRPAWGANYSPSKDSRRGDTNENQEQDVDEEEMLAGDDGLDIEETSDVEDSEIQDQEDSFFDYEE
jgi:hypothetical protein